MKTTIRKLLVIAGIALIAFARPLSAADTASIPLPQALEGVVTPAQYESYVKFQNSLMENPKLKKLSEQMNQEMAKLQVLQKQLNDVTIAAFNADPAQKDVGDKIQKALTAAATKTAAN